MWNWFNRPTTQPHSTTNIDPTPLAQVCRECRVMFKPYERQHEYGGDNCLSRPVEFHDLCPTHRTAAIKNREDRAAVDAWVDRNRGTLKALLEAKIVELPAILYSTGKLHPAEYRYLAIPAYEILKLDKTDGGSR